jgi:hypothetical protein
MRGLLRCRASCTRGTWHDGWDAASALQHGESNRGCPRPQLVSFLRTGISVSLVMLVLRRGFLHPAWAVLGCPCIAARRHQKTSGGQRLSHRRDFPRWASVHRSLWLRCTSNGYSPNHCLGHRVALMPLVSSAELLAELLRFSRLRRLRFSRKRCAITALQTDRTPCNSCVL